MRSQEFASRKQRPCEAVPEGLFELIHPRRCDQGLGIGSWLEPLAVPDGVLLDVTLLASTEAGVKVEPTDVLLLRLEDGGSSKGRKVSAARKLQLESVCQEIEARWSEI